MYQSLAQAELESEYNASFDYHSELYAADIADLQSDYEMEEAYEQFMVFMATLTYVPTQYDKEFFDDMYAKGVLMSDGKQWTREGHIEFLKATPYVREEYDYTYYDECVCPLKKNDTVTDSRIPF